MKRIEFSKDGQRGWSAWGHAGVRPFLFLSFTVVIFLLANAGARAEEQATWTVAVQLHEALSTTNDDGSGDDDIYWQVSVKPKSGSGQAVNCGNEDMAISGEPHIYPEWICSANITGGSAAEVEISIQLWESDGWFTGADDHFDIHPAGDQNDLVLTFKPSNQLLTIKDLPGWGPPGQCAAGGIISEGLNGDDRAKIRFSVSASDKGITNGDSDGDGLLDSWETCGVNSDKDADIEVDLPGMGADPDHKDIFVEVDWMLGTNHSHEPWLPSLMQAWHEMDEAPVTNIDKVPGIALHIDTGDLYRNYNLDLNGDGTPEIDVRANGLDLDGDGINESLDMDNDGVADIGRLGELGNGTDGGGNLIPGAEDLAVTVCDSNTDIGLIKSSFFDSDRQGVFRYALFGHRQNTITNGSSGVSCGSDLYMVSLGGWAQEPVIRGPSGLPVDGRMDDHTGTFLHELGHSLGLGHGGSNGVNYKPNYVSIMNYSYQLGGLTYDFNGDSLADRIIGRDFNHDGQDDFRSFVYSSHDLADLDESSLDESAGISDGPALFLYGPGPLDTNNDSICDLHCGMTWLWGSGFQAVDWSRGDDDGDGRANNDPNISLLTAPPNPANYRTDINSDKLISILYGYDDYRQFKNIGLTKPGKVTGAADEDIFPAEEDISPAEEDISSTDEAVSPAEVDISAADEDISLQTAAFLDRHTNFMTPILAEEVLAQKCAAGAFARINFDNRNAGAVIGSQYAPQAVFNGGGGSPTVVNDVSTHSAPNSLANLANGGTPPALEIRFGAPQRLVGLYLGRQEPGNSTLDGAVMTAYDADGIEIGRVRRLLPAPNQGINTFLGMGAIVPDKLISSITLVYDGTATFEPAHIDDLVMCAEKKEDAQPTFPPPPLFGDTLVQVAVNAEVVSVGPPNAEHQEPLVHTPLTAVPVEVDGQANMTSFNFSRFEGDQLSLKAPQNWNLAGGKLTFLHWIMNGTVIFPDKLATISTMLLGDAQLTAVYATKADGCLLVVNAPEDFNDLNPGNGFCSTGRGRCTLRAAVEEANANRAGCLITVPANFYGLTLAGRGEDAALTGDLDITKDVTILGAGASLTTVDGNQLDTVFDIHQDAHADILGLTIQGGRGDRMPGGIKNEGVLLLGASRLQANEGQAASGGGLANSGTMILLNTPVKANQADNRGGGIFNTGELQILNSEIAGNVALTGDGGGIANADGRMQIAHSAVIGNTADRFGGGIWNNSGILMNNSTVSDNMVFNSGGGIYNAREIEMNNVTISHNGAPSGVGGGLVNTGVLAQIGNSILAGNYDEGESAPECQGVVQSSGYNLLQNLKGCTQQGDQTGNLIGANPRLGPVIDLGNGTRGRELLPNSPAINAANPAPPGSAAAACGLWDQRGISRPQDGRCDMGAVEFPATGDGQAPAGRYRLNLPVVIR